MGSSETKAGTAGTVGGRSGDFDEPLEPDGRLEVVEVGEKGERGLYAEWESTMSDGGDLETRWVLYPI